MVEEKTSHSGKLIALLVCLCLAIVGLVAAIVILSNNKGSLIKETEDLSDPYAAIVDKIVLNDVDGAAEITERAAAGMQSNEEKAQLYQYLVAGIYNLLLGREDLDSKNIELMLQNAYKAEEISPSAGTAYLIYQCEDQFGNKEIAKEYLSLAKERGLPEMGGEG